MEKQTLRKKFILFMSLLCLTCFISIPMPAMAQSDAEDRANIKTFGDYLLYIQKNRKKETKTKSKKQDEYDPFSRDDFFVRNPYEEEKLEESSPFYKSPSFKKALKEDRVKTDSQKGVLQLDTWGRGKQWTSEEVLRHQMQER